MIFFSRFKLTNSINRFLSFRQIIIIFLIVVCANSAFSSESTDIFSITRNVENFAVLSPLSLFVDAAVPTVKFNGLHHYARLSNQVSIAVEATDDIGISRVELYLDQTLIASNEVIPNAPRTTVNFNWNSTAKPNGKHSLQAKVFDAAGNTQTATILIVTHNSTLITPLPTAALTVTLPTISSGQISTLNWTTTDAATVSINQGIGTVTPSGSRAVSPTATTIYTLTATNAAGSTTRNVTVTVTTPPTGNTIVLFPAIIYQTMGGWEATAETGRLYSAAWNNYKNALFDQSVNDLGINRLRVEITSGAENPVDYYVQWRAGQITENEYNAKRYEIINDNADPNTINPNGFKWTQLDGVIDEVVLPLRQRLQARGETLWVSINYVDFGASTFEHKNTPTEYAEFVLAAYQHIQTKYGFVPNSWEVVLEPDTSTAVWSAAQVAQAIKAAGDLLAARGFTPNFVAPSTTNAANAPVYIDQIAQTTGAMAYVGEFSYHRYCCATTTVLQNIATRTVQYDKRSAMLEWIGADYNTLHEDLKLARNSSWQQFTLAGPLIWGPDDGSRYFLIDDANTTSPTIITGSRTKFLQQYFRFIRNGARRIEATSGSANFDPLAFINPNGKYAVVVKATAGGAFTIQNLPAGTYGIKYTTTAQYNIDLPDAAITAGQTLTTNIPAAGVITIYAR